MIAMIFTILEMLDHDLGSRIVNQVYINLENQFQIFVTENSDFF